MKYFVKFNYAAIRLALHMTTFLTLMSIMIIEIRLVKITCCKIQYCSYDYVLCKDVPSVETTKLLSQLHSEFAL